MMQSILLDWENPFGENRMVEGSGPLNAELWLIGEAPGEQEEIWAARRNLGVEYPALNRPS